MKGLRLSKISWLILSAGVFIVILAGLGLTRSQQLQEQTQLDEQLSITEMRVNQMEVAHLQQQQEELQQRLDESTIEHDEAKDRMRQTVVSVDVTDEFFAIAEYSNVVISTLGTSTITTGDIGSIPCSIISLSASVRGDISDMIDFVTNLNNNFITGIVESVNMSISEWSDGEADTSATIQMTIYSYKGI